MYVVYVKDMLSTVKWQHAVFCPYPITKFVQKSCFSAIWRQIFEYLYIKPSQATTSRRIREFHAFPRLAAWRSATLTIQTQHVHMSYFGPSLRFFPRLALSEMAMGNLLVTLTYERF